VYQQFLEVANNRFRLLKIGYLNGERSEADTIEAYTQLQQFKILQTDAQVKLNTAKYELSNFLWDAQSAPLDLTDNALPDTIQFYLWRDQELAQLLTQADTESPILKSYAYKLKILEVEKKLKFQGLLPTINLKANLLNKGYNVLNGMNAAFMQNNYNWGIDLKIPLLMRVGKGEYKKAQLKIAETKLEVNLKKRVIENKVRNYYAEMQLLKQQIEMMQQLLAGYNSLLRAENIKFQNGESTLFIVNSREMKVIEANEKLISLRQKYLKANVSAEWSAGILR
jgi:outer membrane protein TolC